MGILGSGRTAAGRFEFRPRTGIAACAVWALLALIWLALDLQTGISAAARDLPVIGTISTVVYALFARPVVVVDAQTVLLRNVLRDITVPYTSLRRVLTQYVLTLETAGGQRFQSWAAPAGGRFGAARVTDEDRKALGWSSDELPASANLRSDAGAAAVAIRRQWAVVAPAAAAAGCGIQDVPDDVVLGDDRGVQVQWATGVLVTLAAWLIACIAVFVW